MANELALFLRELARNPRRVSAAAPSSRALARAMTAHLSPDTGPVAEFGPGTGVFTRAILSRGVAPRDLTLFEVNPDFAAHLRRSFPGVTVINAGAQTIADHCAGVAAVISGLPLLSFPDELNRAIVTGTFTALRPGGTLTQFTYGPKAPLSAHVTDASGLVATAGPRIWMNLPPARVYTYRRA